MDKEFIAIVSGLVSIIFVVCLFCIIEADIKTTKYNECVSLMATKPAIEINLVCSKISGK